MRVIFFKSNRVFPVSPVSRNDERCGGVLRQPGTAAFVPTAPGVSSSAPLPQACSGLGQGLVFLLQLGDPRGQPVFVFVRLGW